MEVSVGPVAGRYVSYSSISPVVKGLVRGMVERVFLGGIDG